MAGVTSGLLRVLAGGVKVNYFFVPAVVVDDNSLIAGATTKIKTTHAAVKMETWGSFEPLPDFGFDPVFIVHFSPLHGWKIYR